MLLKPGAEHAPTQTTGVVASQKTSEKETVLMVAPPWERRADESGKARNHNQRERPFFHN
jgi:hypothetical protein